MNRPTALRHEFVEYIPEKLDEGVLYVSVGYATAAHKCCCGCGKEVVTPIAPTDWQLMFDGVSVSLHPSIGNWSFPCQSHYWIRQNHVRWAGRLSADAITAVRAHDRMAKERYFDRPQQSEQADGERAKNEASKQRPRFLAWLRRFFT